MSNLLDPQIEKLLKKDKKMLEETEIPIITVSASYKEDLKGFYGLPENEYIPDVVFSRAHFSMAAAVAVQAWGKKINPQKAWVVDPTNYVSNKDWKSVQLTEFVGKTLARQPLLKMLKDFIDKFGRNSLPILDSITPPVLYLTKNIDKPILSMHIATGNILAEHGKEVVQVVTDPHVREDYLNQAHRDNMTFCVFDEKTKIDFLEKAKILGVKVDPKRVIVTGPPVDPRIIKASDKKAPWRSGILNLCITTGGLGTNKSEMRSILKQLMPLLRKKNKKLRILVYTATHQDIYHMVKQIAKEEKIKIGKLSDKKASLRLLYHPQIVDANEALIQYGFPWADGFITKPSGDMAYDAALSGSFVLTLREWGVWEENIEQVFEQLGIAREAQVKHITDQLETLMSAKGLAQSWIEEAMQNAQTISPIFKNGTKNIVQVVRGK